MGVLVKTGYIVHLSDRHLPDALGNKAGNLRRLEEKRFLVPDTYVCTWQAYLDFLREGTPVLERLQQELGRILSPARCYAVRSSANLEDSREHSFAGQFKTFLDISGAEAVLQAVRIIWEETQSAGLRSYLEKVHGGQSELKMAVVIQEMITPVLSGVSFSKNPITGLDEIVVEAIQGSGTALVQDGVTPFRWVHKWGRWIHRPEGKDEWLDLIQEIVAQTQAAARAFKRDVDLEWVYNGQKLYWVQVRDITSAGQTELYSNRMAKELTPGMIKPLVWSVTVPIPGDSWVRLITEVIGRNKIEPGSLAKAFHYRAYHNLGVFGEIFASLGMPRESLEIVMGVAPSGTSMPKFKPGLKFLRHLPRIARFLLDKWSFGRKAAREYPLLEAEAHRIPLDPSSELDCRDLISTTDRAIDLSKRTSYNTVVSILLMQIYSALLRSRLKKTGVDYQQFDLTERLEELKRYDPGEKLAELHTEYCRLEEPLQASARLGEYAVFLGLPEAHPFRRVFVEFLAQFGHLSESGGDFGTVPWRETPGLVLQLAATYQRREEASAPKVRLEDLPLHGLGALTFKVFYQRARLFRLFREKYSSLFTYTLMLLRTYYLALGERMVRDGVLAGREDIYYLYDSEVRAWAAGGVDGQEFHGLIAQRKDEMGHCKDAVLPEVIYGDTLPLVTLSAADKLAGTPTSRGYCTGRVKVILGLGDISRLQPGEVLVIPYSDVSWTPLFAQSCGVVSESGGMLSHSSIIAREFHIPSVVSVPNATHLLKDGDLVTVDGYKGEVIIHRNGDRIKHSQGG